MQIARTQNEKSVAEIVAKVYNLEAGDTRAAAAAKTLLAANPHLNNIVNLPAGTPVVVPQITGLSTTSTAISDPQRQAWMNVLDKLVSSAEQASNAQLTGLATTAPTTPDAKRTAALATLRKDIAQFKKLHSS
jgi:Phage Tail Protein X